MFVGPAFAQAQQRIVTAQDLVTFTDVPDLQLSPDGTEVLYMTRRKNPITDRTVDELWQMSIGEKARRISAAKSAHMPRWAPGGGVSYLASADTSAQLYLLKQGAARPRQLTRHKTGVIAYAWAGDGRHIAFTTADHQPSDQSRGIVISKADYICCVGLGSPDLFAYMPRRTELWLLDVRTGGTRRIDNGRPVRDFAWSPSGKDLAFTAEVEGGLAVFVGQRADLLIYSARDSSVRTLLAGTQGQGYDGTISYGQPTWSPDGRRIAFLREDHTDRWATIPELGVVTILSGAVAMVTGARSVEFYDARMQWLTDERILVENNLRGRHGLFAISVTDGGSEPLLYNTDDASGFTFSVRAQRVAWVRQSVAKPPEMYIADGTFARAHRITALNPQYDSIWLPRAEIVRWTAPDGVVPEGWLLRPRGYDPRRRYPLLVLVHGGPIGANVNRFQPYVSWPYPMQVFAADGYLVFLPNYRHTGSYGKTFRQPTAPDLEPIDDIRSGIDHLVAAGLADPELIGLMGHSHGGWLGPIVVSRAGNFRAASFAEGSTNLISLYGYAPSWLNKGVHEYHFVRGTPYDQLKRYIDLSPIFLAGTARTPTLLEFGHTPRAIHGLEYASALWHYGIPHELVIYPRTDHNIFSPTLALDAMERNLEWFDFWMLGRRRFSQKNRGKYEHWEALRAGKKLSPSFSPQSIKEPVAFE